MQVDYRKLTKFCATLLRALPPQRWGGQVFVPNDPEESRAAVRRKNGIPLPSAVVDQLDACAVAADLPRLERL